MITAVSEKIPSFQDSTVIVERVHFGCVEAGNFLFLYAEDDKISLITLI